MSRGKPLYVVRFTFGGSLARGWASRRAAHSVHQAQKGPVSASRVAADLPAQRRRFKGHHTLGWVWGYGLRVYKTYASQIVL